MLHRSKQAQEDTSHYSPFVADSPPLSCRNQPKCPFTEQKTVMPQGCENRTQRILYTIRREETTPRVDYRPGICPPCIIAAFCSWKRSFKRPEAFIYLSTQRMTQPSSREIRDLVVKSLTQLSKQRWTSLEYICMAENSQKQASTVDGSKILDTG